MKVIQLNIWQGKLGQQIIDFLKAEKPDFVCMQEVNNLEGRSGYKFFATLNDIKEKAGFEYAFMSPAYSSRYMEREMEYGNAILSKPPFISTETVFTRDEFVTNFDIEQRDGNIRNLQVATVEVYGQKLNILNHHGHWVFGSKAGDDETLRQMQIIVDTLKRLTGPVIMCGDFNLAPDSKSIKLVNKRLRNLSIENGLKRTYNQLSMVNDVCDYIFVNDQVKVKNFKMSDELVSDHKALILEFEL